MGRLAACLVAAAAAASAALSENAVTSETLKKGIFAGNQHCDACLLLVHEMLVGCKESPLAAWKMRHPKAPREAWFDEVLQGARERSIRHWSWSPKLKFFEPLSAIREQYKNNPEALAKIDKYQEGVDGGWKHAHRNVWVSELAEDHEEELMEAIQWCTPTAPLYAEAAAGFCKDSAGVCEWVEVPPMYPPPPTRSGPDPGSSRNAGPGPGNRRPKQPQSPRRPPPKEPKEPKEPKQQKEQKEPKDSGGEL
eukprot:TRINITY_DN10076_c0_g2_i1.p1 TRINITY_DN10076_c0_g2~~TRINITY_DN10076_c0_g2_i1.p1  ORF type:complete len:278 (+),score=96.80 TRINITY_DN10076_c0_g2_i1:83-835(+)